MGWSAEAYGSDAITPLAFHAGKANHIKLGTGIMQLAARTPANAAMSAASIDAMAGGGRFILRQTHRTRRTGAFAVGDVDTILARVDEYVDAGVSKFILRPLGGDDEAILTQTRLLIEQVLPRAEARWPRRAKVTATDR